MPVENARTSYFPTEIKLAEDGAAPSELQILRVGKFSHPRYGDFEITPKMLAEFKTNFDNNVRRVDPAIDYKHDNEDVAAGWPKAVVLRDGGKSLWFSDIKWTPKGEQVLKDKEFRYFSPEFVQQWTDPETGKTYNNVLFGGGLTNRPFIKGMEPITKLGEGQSFADDMQACVAGWIPELIKKGHTQDEAVAIAYSKCGEKKMAEIEESIKLGGPGSGRHSGGGKSEAERVASRQSNLSKSNAAQAAFVNRSNAIKSGIQAKGARVLENKSVAQATLARKKARMGLDETKGGMEMDEKDQRIAELEQQLADCQAEIEKLKGGNSAMMVDMQKQNAKMCDEIKSLTEKIATTEKEKAFNILLSEGKACAAQKDAYMKGDMAEFASKAQKVNLSENGNSQNPSNVEGDKEDKVLKLAEEKRKADKTLSGAQAISMVLSEHPELN